MDRGLSSVLIFFNWSILTEGGYCDIVKLNLKRIQMYVLLKKEYEMKKRLTAIIAIAAMIVTMVPSMAFAASVWDGSSIATGYAGGNGSADDPYKISSAAEFAYFAQQVNGGETYSGKYLLLTDDIDLNSKEWTPIGYNGKTFKGNFDGGNKTISNLVITKELANTGVNNGIGLFGRTDSPASIKNFTIENVDVTGSLYVGGVVGFAYTGESIENITVKGNITIDAWWYAGVIGGNGYMNKVDNCHVIGNPGSYIKGNDGSYIGGIWGFRGEGAQSITNCTVKGLDITGVDRVGGISGMAHYGNAIKDCAVEDVSVQATDVNAKTVGLITGANQGGDGGNAASTVINNDVKDTTAKVGDKEVSNLSGTTIGDVAAPSSLVGSDVTFDPTTGDITGGVLESYVDGTISDDADLATVTNPDGTKTTAVGTETIKDIIESASSGTKVIIDRAEDGTDYGKAAVGVTVVNGTAGDIKVDGKELAEGEKLTGVAVPAKPDNSPNTGDNSVASFAVAGLVLAAIAAAAVARRRYN